MAYTPKKRPAPRKRGGNDDELVRTVGLLVKDAEAYRDERSLDRITAMEYFDGIMKDVPSDVGRSKVVSRDVRAAVRKVLPSVMRVLLGGDEIVQYTPIGPGDENMAEQATDYVNLVLIPECNGDIAIEDAINDAIRLRSGILKWYQETKIDTKTSTHTGLDEFAFAALAGDDDVTVLEHTERQEKIDPGTGDPPQLETVHDIKIRRNVTTSKTRLKAIPLENFLIHPDATTIEESPIVGENCQMRRTDLVAMGYDKDLIWSLKAYTADTSESEVEADTRRRDVFQHSTDLPKELDEIDYYDLLIRADYDGDGIAELRRVIFAGGLKVENMLENTEWDEMHYQDVIAERRPHQLEGNSTPDEAMEIQKIKTVLLRQTLDNLYWQNNPQPAVQEGVVSNMDAVLNPKFGQPILVGQGVDVQQAIKYQAIPFFAEKSYAMLEYLDKELEDRTGINDSSGGLPPDAMQNVTAAATAMIESSGLSQIHMTVKCVARCLAPVFKGLLKLTIQHQTKPRIVYLRGQWVNFDPRYWNGDMSALVNTGLGAGTRERDMMAVQQVIGLQEKITAALGPDNPFVKPDNIYNAISDFVKATGLRNVERFFTKPDPAEIEKAKEEAAKTPPPEVVQAQAQAEAQIKVEGVKNQGKVELEKIKSQQKTQERQAQMLADANKEREQRDADMAVQTREIGAKAQDANTKNLIAAEKNDIEREKLAAQIAMHEEDLESQERQAEAKRKSDEQKAAADRFTQWQASQEPGKSKH